MMKISRERALLIGGTPDDFGDAQRRGDAELEAIPPASSSCALQRLLDRLALRVDLEQLADAVIPLNVIAGLPNRVRAQGRRAHAARARGARTCERRTRRLPMRQRRMAACIRASACARMAARASPRIPRSAVRFLTRPAAASAASASSCAARACSCACRS
jgi:hypothetical protein